MRRYHLALPFLFAAHPVLYLYAHNFGSLRLPQILLPLAASLAFGLVVLLVSRLIVKDWAKAVLAASVFLVIFYAYGYAADVIFARLEGQPINPTEIALSPVVCLLSIYLAAFVAGHPSDLRRRLNTFTVGAIALVAASLIQIVPRELTRTHPILPRVAEADVQIDPEAPACKSPPPDIYYIILDRYAGPNATTALFGFDNHEFLDWLRGKGFYVATESRANYARTCLSLSSSLNLIYLTDLVRQMGKSSADETPTYEMIQDNTLQRFLKAHGYRYIHTGSWWEPTRFNRHADVNLGSPFLPLSQFSRLFLTTTLARPFLASLRVVPDPPVEHRGFALYQFDRLSRVPTEPGPKFVFAHILLPHQPVVFGANGESVTGGQFVGSLGQLYGGQFSYANRRVQELIVNILAHSQQPPIIIVQADEGMDLPMWGDTAIQVDGLTLPTGRRRHFDILNAYYLPGLNKGELYPSISPVNSFRVVLNHYFGTRLKLLPDESWLIRGTDRPYDQANVTEYVR